MAVTVDVLANDSDVDGDALTVIAAGTPYDGATVLNPDGTITYTSKAGFSGSDSFTYDLSDGFGGTATAAVSVTISPLPTVYGTDYRDVIDLSGETTSQTVFGEGGNDQITGSPAGDTIVGGSGDDVLNGAGGDDVFLYEGTGNGADQVDGGAGFDVIRGGAGDDVFGFRGNAVVNVEKIDGGAGFNVIQGDDNPMSRDTLDFSSVELVNIERIDGRAGNDQITGSQAGDTIVGGSGDDVLNGAGGDDVFVYEGTGNGHDEVDGGAGFDVLRGGDGDDVFGFRGNGVVNVEKIDGGAGFNVIQGDDNPMSGDRLDFSSVELVNIARIDGGRGHDIITGSAGGDNLVDGSGTDQLSGGGGADTFALTASDLAVDTIKDFSGAGGDGDVIDLVAFGANASVGFDPVSRILTVNGEDVAKIVGDFDPTTDVRSGSGNAAPVARDDSVIVAAGTSVTPDLLHNDTDLDGDQLTITSFSDPAHGAVTRNSPLTYTPDPGFVGADTFTYVVSDGNGGTATATVAVTVTANSVNDAPVAEDDTVTTNEDTPATLDVLVNDTDPNGDALTVTAVGTAAMGSAVLNANGNITYTPGANFHGTDTFTYTVSDGNGGTDTAAVQVTVNAVNDTPVAVNDIFTVAQDTTLTASSVLDNDIDVDGDGLNASLVSGPAHGSLALNVDGSFNYTPQAGFVGTDGFTYKASDGNGGTGSASVTVNVTAPGGLSDLVAGMTPGEWVLIPNSDMRDVLLTNAESIAIVSEEGGGNIWGWSGSSSVLKAWNSAAYDPEGHRWFFMGGGHADYGGNEVYQYDFDTLQWTRLTEPSPLTVQQSDGHWIPESGPISPHTYDGAVWNPVTGTLWQTSLYSGYSVPAGPSVNPDQKADWEFDPDTGTWTPHALDENLPHGSSVFMPGDNVVFATGKNVNNGSERGYFIDSAGNYTLANSGSYVGNYSSVSNMFRIPDSASPALAGRIFEAHSQGMVELFLDATAATFSVSATDPIPDLGFDKSQAGYVFDPVDEWVYVWNGGREVYTWDIQTDTWRTLSNADSSVAPNGSLSGAGKIFDKWIYLEDQGVFAGIQDAADGGIWLWKPEL